MPQAMDTGYHETLRFENYNLDGYKGANHNHQKGLPMSTEIEKYTNNSRVIRVVREPGNGTRYEAVGVKMPKDFPEVAHFWLISFPLIGASYYFREGAYLDMSYVSEKLAYQRNGVKVCEVDLHEMAKCITTIVGGTHNAATDDAGRFPVVRIAP